MKAVVRAFASGRAACGSVRKTKWRPRLPYCAKSPSGLVDLASGRYDDVDEHSLDDFIGQPGIGAATTQSAG